MSPDLFKQIVDLLTPHLESESTRRALLDKALGVDERAARLKNQLNFSGSTDAFTTQLVRKLIQSGNKFALISVLREAQASTGFDYSQRIESVIRELESDSNFPSFSQPTRKLGLPITLVVIALILLIGIGWIALEGLDGVSNTSENRTGSDGTTYPCSTTIIFTTGAQLNAVRAQPSIQSASRPTITQGATVSILDIARTGDDTWYQIEYGDNSGWILERHINPC